MAYDALKDAYGDVPQYLRYLGGTDISMSPLLETVFFISVFDTFPMSHDFIVQSFIKVSPSANEIPQDEWYLRPPPWLVAPFHG